MTTLLVTIATLQSNFKKKNFVEPVHFVSVRSEHKAFEFAAKGPKAIILIKHVTVIVMVSDFIVCSQFGPESSGIVSFRLIIQKYEKR